MQLRREHELSRLRADFISSVSHELRTPLSQILLFAETLNLGRVRTEQERRAATDVIVQEGRRLMHLVENILHFSRAERRMSRLGLEPLDLSRAVAAIVEDWLPLASAADVRVETQFAPDVHAVADRSALRQMVLNLLDNAVKYGPATQTVTVGTSVVRRRPACARACGSTTRATAFPPRERERVWESFYRLDRRRQLVGRRQRHRAVRRARARPTARRRRVGRGCAERRRANRDRACRRRRARPASPTNIRRPPSVRARTGRWSRVP